MFIAGRTNPITRQPPFSPLKKNEVLYESYLPFGINPDGKHENRLIGLSCESRLGIRVLNPENGDIEILEKYVTFDHYKTYIEINESSRDE